MEEGIEEDVKQLRDVEKLDLISKGIG
jgi:hypothetical protein